MKENWPLFIPDREIIFMAWAVSWDNNGRQCLIILMMKMILSPHSLLMAAFGVVHVITPGVRSQNIHLATKRLSSARSGLVHLSVMSSRNSVSNLMPLLVTAWAKQQAFFPRVHGRAEMKCYAVFRKLIYSLMPWLALVMLYVTPGD